jgi:pimeloyl-ACP methyl ester carboxylesterase
MTTVGALVAVLMLAATTADAQIVERQTTVYDFDIRYSEAGSGPPVVVLHGLWGGRNEWEPVIEPISRDHRVLIPDLPGFGASDKPPANYHNALLAQFVIGFMDALDLRRATLAGHAMGANLATFMAVHHPDRVERLILVDGAGYQRDEPRSGPLPVPFVRTVTGSTIPATKAFLMRRVENDALVTDAWAERAFVRWLKSADAIEQMLGVGGEVTVEEMRGIHAPTLILWGREDGVSNVATADRVHADIAGSQLVIFEGCGHLPQLERTEEFISAVRSFLAEAR